MPSGPVAGRENVKKMIAGFIGSWTETRWDILNLVSAGDVDTRTPSIFRSLVLDSASRR
jgi:hypothetical protein